MSGCDLFGPVKVAEIWGGDASKWLGVGKVRLVKRASFRDIESWYTTQPTEGTPQCRMLPARSSVWQDCVN